MPDEQEFNQQQNSATPTHPDKTKRRRAPKTTKKENRNRSTDLKILGYHSRSILAQSRLAKALGPIWTIISLFLAICIVDFGLASVIIRILAVTHFIAVDEVPYGQLGHKAAKDFSLLFLGGVITAGILSLVYIRNRLMPSQNRAQTILKFRRSWLFHYLDWVHRNEAICALAILIIYELTRNFADHPVLEILRTSLELLILFTFSLFFVHETLERSLDPYRIYDQIGMDIFAAGGLKQTTFDSSKIGILNANIADLAGISELAQDAFPLSKVTIEQRAAAYEDWITINQDTIRILYTEDGIIGYSIVLPTDKRDGERYASAGVSDPFIIGGKNLVKPDKCTSLILHSFVIYPKFIESRFHRKLIIEFHFRHARDLAGPLTSELLFMSQIKRAAIFCTSLGFEPKKGSKIYPVLSAEWFHRCFRLSLQAIDNHPAEDLSRERYRREVVTFFGEEVRVGLAPGRAVVETEPNADQETINSSRVQ